MDRFIHELMEYQQHGDDDDSSDIELDMFTKSRPTTTTTTALPPPPPPPPKTTAPPGGIPTSAVKTTEVPEPGGESRAEKQVKPKTEEKTPRISAKVKVKIGKICC